MDDRQKTKGQLLQEIETLRSRLEEFDHHLPGAIFHFVIDEAGAWHFPYVSKSLINLIGVSAEAVMADAGRLRTLVHPADQAVLTETILTALQTCSPFELSFRLLPPAGLPTWVHARSTPQQEADGRIIWRGMAIDITAQMQIEEAYHALVDHSLQGLMIAQDERIVFCNNVIATISGLSVEKLQTMSSAELLTYLHPDDKQIIVHTLQHMIQAAPNKAELAFRLVRPSGQVRWVEAVASVVPYNGRSALHFAIVDVTDRHEAETAARLNRERYERTIEAALDAFVLLECMRDAEDRLSDFRIVELNDHAAGMLRQPRQTLIGARLLELFPTERMSDFMEQYRQVVETGKSQISQMQFTGKHARPGWYHQHVVKVGDGVAIMIRDITERMEAEAKVLQSERQLRTVLEALPTVVIMHQDSVIQYINRSGAKILGSDAPESLVGESVRQFVDPDSLPLIAERAANVAANQQNKPADIKVVRKDGETIFLQTVSMPLNDFQVDKMVLLVAVDVTERKQMEQALQARESFLNAIFAHSMSGIMVADDAGNYLFANQAAADLLGYPISDLLQMNVAQLQTPDPQDLTVRYSDYLEKGEETGEFHFVRADGTRRVALYNACRVDENFNLSVLADITDKKLAEIELRHSERRFRRLFNGLPIPTYTWQRRGDNFIFVNFNDAAQTITRGTLKGLLGIHATEMYADRPEIVADMNACYREHQTIEREMWYPFSSGQRRFLNVKYTYVPEDLVIVLTEDLTERQRAAEQYRAFFTENVSSVFWIELSNPIPVDLPTVEQANLILKEGYVQDVSESVAHLYGFARREELVGRPVRIIWHADLDVHTDKDFKGLKLFVENGYDLQQFESLQITQSGAAKWVWLNAHGIVENGRLQRIWGSLIDVTERKQRQQEQVRQERLAAVGQLAAGVAHDFNNVLAVITLYTELLSQSDTLKKKELRQLQTIQKQANHAADLTRQILDFSRRSIREPRPLDLRVLLKDMLSFVKRTIPERIRVHFTYDATDLGIHADPTQVQQIITNLTVNARDALPQGGAIHFHLSRLSLHPDETCPCEMAGVADWIVLRIQDTGEGIAPEALPHIFEPFFTTKEVGQGAGLGLAQVYGIVKQHDGCITVDSQPGSGTAFTIYFPALTKLPTPAQAAPRTAVDQQGRGETILLVEDNTQLLEAARHALESLNYEVLPAENGQEAMAIFAQHEAPIDLVLTDVSMPFMDGFELLQALQAQPTMPKVVMMSGFPRDNEMPEELQASIAAWLTKPLDLTLLAETLAEALRA